MTWSVVSPIPITTGSGWSVVSHLSPTIVVDSRSLTFISVGHSLVYCYYIYIIIYHFWVFLVWLYVLYVHNTRRDFVCLYTSWRNRYILHSRRSRAKWFWKTIEECLALIAFYIHPALSTSHCYRTSLRLSTE